MTARPALRWRAECEPCEWVGPETPDHYTADVQSAVHNHDHHAAPAPTSAQLAALDQDTLL